MRQHFVRRSSVRRGTDMFAVGAPRRNPRTNNQDFGPYLSIGSRLARRESPNKNAALPEGNAAFCLIVTCKEEFLVLGRPGSDLLSQGLSHSTIGAEEFNGRVRDGIGFKLLARTTRPAKDKETKQARTRKRSSAVPGLDPGTHVSKHLGAGHAHDALWTLKMRAIKPIERLVPVSYMRCRTYTPGLSTWSSSTVLKGILVLRWVSRLDAFSGYPVRT